MASSLNGIIDREEDTRQVIFERSPDNSRYQDCFLFSFYPHRMNEREYHSVDRSLFASLTSKTQ